MIKTILSVSASLTHETRSFNDNIIKSIEREIANITSDISWII